MPALRSFCLVTIAAACLLFAPLPATAASGASGHGSPALFHGFYAGGFAGVATFDSELSYSGNSTDGLAATGLSNGVFLGTGTVYEQIYFALEGNIAYNNADFSEELGIYQIEGDLKESYGASARAGGLVAERVLAYCLAGWQEVNIDVSDNTGWSQEKRFNGVRLGVGMEYQTSQNVFLRGEYCYTLYKEKTLSGGGTKYEIDPDAGLFQLGIGFRF